MNFRKFFEKNYNLIKLNFVLLGTFIFFLVLQLGQQSYAVTDAELQQMDLTPAQWAEKVLKNYNIGNLPYIVQKCYDGKVGAQNTVIYVFPDFTVNTVLFMYSSGNNGLLNFCNATDISQLSFDSFAVNDANDGINLITLDYTPSNGFTIKRDYKKASKIGNASFNTGGTGESFRLFYEMNIFPSAIEDVKKTILYTNMKYYLQPYVNQFYEFEGKELAIYDYESYVTFNNSELEGNYITFSNDLKNTDVSTVVIKGSNLMGNGVTSYTVSTLMNFDALKVYTNDSEVVTLEFKNASNQIVYTFTKNYKMTDTSSELFDYRYDVSNSEIVTFNGTEFYKKMDLYYKFNNIYNYNIDSDLDSIVYIPTVYYEYIFNNGEVFSTQKFYYNFDTTYYINLKSALEFYIDAQADPDAFSNFAIDYSVNSLGGRMVELFLDGYLYSVRINFAIEEWKAFNSGNYAYVKTVNKLPIVQNFVVNQNFGSGTVVEIIDNDGNDAGYVVVDKDGNIITDGLIDGYTIQNGSIYDKNGNLIGAFNKTDNGWNFLDENGNVINQHNNIVIPNGGVSNNDSDSDFDFGNIIGGIDTIVSTITNGLGALLSSVSGIGTLFATAFSWLPSPIPELVTFAFVCVVLFAIIRFIRGH